MSRIKPVIVPKTIPAIWPGDRSIFVDVDSRRGASVGVKVVIVLSLVMRVIVVNVIVAVFETRTIVRLVELGIGIVLVEW